MTVEFRPVKINDIDAIVEEYERTWGIAHAVGADASRNLSRRFVLHYLEPSTFGTVATINGKFMGLLLARVYGDKVLFKQVQKMLEEQEAKMSSKGDSLHAKALDSAIGMGQIERKLEAMSHINDLTQAELELFIVSPDARGHGVGGGLWKRTMQHLRHRGVNRYFLHTDTACDVSFYDYHGLKRDATWAKKDHEKYANRVKDLVEDLYIYSGEPFVNRTRRTHQSR